MSTTDQDAEYRALLSLDESVSFLRGFGWSRDDLIERVETTCDDVEAEEADA